MRRIFAEQGRAVVRDVPKPELRSGEVLIDTSYSAVSAGTEMWLLEGSSDPDFVNHEYPTSPPRWPKTRTPIERNHPLPRDPDPTAISLGYSLSGVVIDVDDRVVDLSPGDRVAASGSQAAHHAEVVAVPRNLVARVPDGVDLRDAALVTVGAIATTALRDTDCQFGETIVLYGMGLLGLLAGQIGKSAGYRIVGIDIDDSRLEMARQLGIGHMINSQREDATARIKELTDGYGADAVILGVKTASSEPLNHSFDMCRQRGRVVAQGLFGWEIDRSRLFANQVTLIPAIGYGLGRYDPVYEEGNVDYPIGLARWTENRNQEYFLSLLADEKIATERIAPVRIPISDAPTAYDLLRSDDRPPTIIFEYPSAT